jgi:hypothetical protein
MTRSVHTSLKLMILMLTTMKQDIDICNNNDMYKKIQLYMLTQTKGTKACTNEMKV